MTLDDIKAKYSGAQTFTFGDNRALCNELMALVRAGRKTATCEALRVYENSQEALPVVGRRDIALDWDGRPALVIETVDVTVCRFCDVGEDFALAEGENDSLAGWRAAHETYFARSGGFDPQMMLMCERFKLIEDLAGSSQQ